MADNSWTKAHTNCLGFSFDVRINVKQDFPLWAVHTNLSLTEGSMGRDRQQCMSGTPSLASKKTGQVNLPESKIACDPPFSVQMDTVLQSSAFVLPGLFNAQLLVSPVSPRGVRWLESALVKPGLGGWFGRALAKPSRSSSQWNTHCH